MVFGGNGSGPRWFVRGVESEDLNLNIFPLVVFFVPPPGEVGPGLDGLSGPWADFEGARMVSPGCEKVMGGQLRLGDQLPRGCRGVERDL